MIAVDPQLVARFEIEAATQPRRYLLRVAVTALLGDFMLMFLQLLPIAILLGLPLLLYRQPLFYWAGGAAFLFFVWVLRPGMRWSGRELSRAEAPALFAEIDAMRRALDVPNTMRVFINDEFNASAAESRGLFGLIGTTRVLTLGMPLLATLPREHTLAVIAHELGHFSRRHGRLGHWLYRARVGWLHQLEAAHTDDSSYDKAIAAYGKAFAPYFMALSFAYARRCEYEADADAASVVGAANFAGALCSVEVQAGFWHAEMDRQVAVWSREQESAPGDFYTRAALLAGLWEATHRDRVMQTALETPANFRDTHPTLAQRLVALHSKPVTGNVGASRGAELLGNAWAVLCAEFNAAWRMRNQLHWSARHYYYRAIGSALLAAPAQPMSAVQALSRARALREVLPQDSLAELARLHRQWPRDDDIAYLYAIDLIAITPDAAIEILKTVWQRAPLYRALIGWKLHAHFVQHGDVKQAELWNRKHEAARQQRAAANVQILPLVETGAANQPRFSNAVEQYLQAVLGADECVVAAWIFHSQHELVAARGDSDGGEGSDSVAVYALWLLLDTDSLARAGRDEDHAAAQHVSALGRVVLPRDEILVNTTLTTEKLPAALEGKRALFERK